MASIIFDLQMMMLRLNNLPENMNALILNEYNCVL